MKVRISPSIITLPEQNVCSEREEKNSKLEGVTWIIIRLRGTQRAIHAVGGSLAILFRLRPTS